jgi:predicted RNA-binding Zn-ribbon protein involved in translation (DUF1610 family)
MKRRIKMIGDWYTSAIYCEETYGSTVHSKEGWFVCPECGEVLYSEDWKRHDWETCPVCGFNFFTGECEEPEEDYYDEEEEE